jgi:hypothetical protein
MVEAATAPHCAGPLRHAAARRATSPATAGEENYNACSAAIFACFTAASNIASVSTPVFVL